MREWMDAVNLYDDGDVDDICVADVDGEFDESGDVDVETDAEFLCGLCDGRDDDPINHVPEVSVVCSLVFTDADRQLGVETFRGD